MKQERRPGTAIATALLLVLAAAGCTSTEEPAVRPTQAALGTSASTSGTSAAGFTAYTAERAPRLPVLTGADLMGSTLTVPAAGRAVTIVNVWASWCQPCVAEMPKLRSVAERFAADDVVVLGIARDKTAPAVSFLSTTGFDLSSLADSNGAKAARWSSVVPAAAVPATLLVDASGRVRARWIGPVDETRLGDEVCATLAQEKHTAAACPG